MVIRFYIVIISSNIVVIIALFRFIAIGVFGGWMGLCFLRGGRKDIIKGGY